MTTQEILNSRNTKTAKMRMLFELGLTRREVADLMQVGYGFVQNVYAKTYPERIQRRTLQEIIEDLTFEFTFDRKFGIEIEAFGVNRNTLERALTNAGINVNTETYNHETRNYWKLITDASVNGTHGFELVSPPLKGEDGLEELKIVCRVLKEKNVKINKSCGLHIHHEVRDYKVKNFKNLYINYARLEKSIDKFMPNSRRESNNYYLKSMVKENYENKIKNSRDLRSIERNITRRDRYYKLNTQSYWRYGTVEFRQHSGTIEFDKISNWILFTSRLVEFSKNNIVENGNFETLKKFTNENIYNFYQNRKQNLAA